MELSNARLRTILVPSPLIGRMVRSTSQTLGSVTGWPNQLSFVVGVEYEARYG